MVGLTPCVCSTSFAQPGGATEPVRPRPAEAPVDPIASFIDLARRVHGLPAVGFAVFNSETMLDSMVVGLREAAGTENVTKKDLFHIGSCTKAMTATAIASLVQDGVISWDTTIGEVFGEDQRIHAKFHPVTLRQLMKHRGGVDPMTQGTQDWLRRMKAYQGTPMEQRRAFVSDILWTEPINEPGSTMVYSNAGYSVAAALAEAKSGESWESLLETRVFAPLGMTEFGFGWPGTPGVVDQPRGHVLIQGRTLKTIQPDDEYILTSSLAPAGDVSCSIDSFARFAQAHLRAITGEPPILDKQMFETLHTAEGTYAMGWIVGTQDDRTIYAHEGSAGTFFCSVLLDPDADLGIVVCVNTGGGQRGCRLIAQQMLAQYGPVEEAATSEGAAEAGVPEKDSDDDANNGDGATDDGDGL